MYACMTKTKRGDTGERILFADYLKTRDTEIPDYRVVLSKTAQKQLDKFPDSLTWIISKGEDFALFTS